MEILKLEHHAVIKFLFIGGCTATAIHKRLVALYSESSPNYCAINRWRNEFKCGHQSLEGDPCSGRLYDAVNQLLIATAEKMVLEK